MHAASLEQVRRLIDRLSLRDQVAYGEANVSLLFEYFGDEVMTIPVVSQLEDSISQLPLSEQLRLIERLVQRIRENTISQQSRFESDLVAMANDSEIQHELRLIEEEFTFAEADGLETG